MGPHRERRVRFARGRRGGEAWSQLVLFSA
jgi:hypothetical protein